MTVRGSGDGNGGWWWCRWWRWCWFTPVVLVFLLCIPQGLVRGQATLAPDDVPPGAASLAFVFDITGSMYDDLVQVIEGAAKILATARRRKHKPLFNYVLVPFHDPEVGPTLVTTDMVEFQEHLMDLYVQGGGDCPEMSIGAIQEALRVSLPNSFIYVFTDARARDYYLVEEVLALIQQKQSQVVFVLTGDCGDTTHRGFKAYEEIASTSSGQVFLLKKSQVNEVLDFVREAVQARKVNLLSIDSDQARAQQYTIPIDSQLQEVTVSVSGEAPRIFLKDPSGQRLRESDGLKELLNIRNVLVVHKKNPEPGEWTLRVASTGPHTIRVTGLSPTDFSAGFSKHPTRDSSQTSLRPVQGIPTHVLLNTTELEAPGRLTTLQLVDLQGEVLQETPVVPDPSSPSLYNTTSFVPPDQFFYLKVNGYDKKGYPLQRTTPTAISPRVPTPPKIFMKDVTRGFFDQTAVLTCWVDSLVPYTVRWFRGNVQQGYDLFFSDSANATLEIPKADSRAEGDYFCNVTNSAGARGAKTYLDISDPPPVILPPQNVSVLPGEDAVLSCSAFSTVPYNLTWSKEGGGRPFSLDPRVSQLQNGSLLVRQVGRSETGRYLCTASNEGGSATESVHLRLQVAPQPRTIPAEQSFRAGDSANVTCISEGYPTPSFQWLREGKLLLPGDRVIINSNFLLLRDLQQTDEGVYECVALNRAGQSSAPALLSFIEAPRIREYERKVLVATGTSARLYCGADGIPPPNITWYRNGRMLQPAYNVDVTRTGYLVIHNVQELDGGSYQCVAANQAGSDSATVLMEVGSSPEIVIPPRNTGVEIEKNGTLACEAVGVPPPKLSWRQGEGRPLDPSSSRRFTQLPSGSLHIQEIQVEDEGIFTCIAQNDFGVTEASAFVSVTGIVRPLIAYTYPFLRVREGSSADLDCVILLGKPQPSLTWLRQGRPLTPGEHVTRRGPGKLTLRDVREEDEGEYVCLASNVGGNATYTVSLDVLVPPKSVAGEGEERKNFSVVQGRGVVLPCEVEGDPPPSFSWYRDGSPIPYTDIHYFIREDGSLEIFSADTGDTGEYECVASNVAGETSKKMRLHVQVGPSIEGGLEERLEVVEGDPVLLPCRVTGDPPPALAWRRNFVPLQDPTSRGFRQEGGGLFLARARLQDKAIYECLASNVAGNASKVITLVVYVPPTIEGGGGRNVTVLEGEEVSLPCQARGDPRPQVQWRRNGTVLDVGDLEGRYIQQPSGSVTIARAVVRDTGTYTCTASNPAGTASELFRLTVHAPPSISPDLPDKLDIIEGNTVILPCPAQGTPRPEITWFKDNVPIATDAPGVRVLGDGSLELDESEAEDSGSYRCTAQNVAGTDIYEVDLKILVPPKFGPDGGDASVPEDRKVIVNDSVTLDCPVSEDTDPPPVLTWFKDSAPLTPGSLDPRLDISRDGRRLTIGRALVPDAGRYRCVASNVAGQVEKRFNLDVQVPPAVDETTASPGNMSVVLNQPLYINCPVTGVPPPSVTWLKDGQPLAVHLDPNLRLQANGRQLEVQNARVRDRGRYRCVAANVAGETGMDFDVTVFVPPTVERPGEVDQNEVISGQPLRLTCPAAGIPLPTVHWFKQNVPISTNSSKHLLLDQGWTLEVRDAQPQDAARYFCRAENVAGEMDKAFDVNVLTPPTIDRNRTDTDPRVLVNTTAVLSCPVSGNPLPEVIWYRNGVRLDATLHPRYQVLADGRQLRIHHAQVKDTGEYTCSTRNKAGDDSLDYQLQVQVPPTIDRKATDLKPEVIEGSSVTLDCPASGTPPPRVTWYRGGQPLVAPSGGGNVQLLNQGRQLRLLRAAVADAGLYQCRAQNEAGETDANFQLSVHVPPTIPDAGVDRTPQVVENETVTLDCPAQGVPPPAVSWTRNGLPLDLEASPHISLQDGGRRLVIEGAQVPDSGAYSCVASNVAGEVESDFNVEVWLPPKIDRNLQDREPKVIKGQTTTINCPVSGIPFPTITWLKGGNPLPADGRVRLLNGGLQLQVINASESDAARYTCQVHNPAGQDRVDYQLTVLVPPSIDESNVVYRPRVIQGRRVILECPVSGIPEPDVTWLVNQSPLVESPSIQLKGGGRQLEIPQAQVSDSARYTCIAINEAGELERNFDLEVLVPPSIDRDRVTDQRSVVENQTVTLECPVSGQPPPSIMWLKDLDPLLDFPYPDLRVLDGSRRLEVSNAQLQDAGTYTCSATNPAGRDEVSIDLAVHVPPEIEGSATPTARSVISGDPVSMECKVARGVPAPSLLWFRDGSPLNASSNSSSFKQLSGGALLQLLAAEVKDAARYTCHAENVAGFAEKSYDVDVMVPPQLNGSNELQTEPVVLDQPVILSCPAEGVPPPEITWYRHDRPIPPYGMANIRVLDGGRQLFIISAQLLDFGSYRCQAVNPAGHASLEYLVTVLVPPELGPGPERVAPNLNTRALLSCEASGQPQPEVTWEKDGEPFPSTGLRHRQLTSGSLEFTAVQLQDVGRYTCTASNPAGNVSRTVTLDVQVPARILHSGPSTVKAELGGSIIMPCDVEGTPSPRIVWLKNRGVLLENDNLVIMPNGSLYIRDISLGQNGVYTCIAQNFAGIDKRDTRLQVQVPPTIQDGQSEFTVLQNRTVVLPCQSEGVPWPQVHWEKEGQEITGAQDFRISYQRVQYILLQTGGLAIPHAKSEDAGTYTCVAENEAGRAERNVTLVVQVPPIIDPAPRQYVTSVGEGVVIPCSARGIPPPAMDWTLNGRSLQRTADPRFRVASNGSLLISNILATDTGNYVCTASNLAGRDSSRRLLRVQVPPRFVQRPTDKEVTVNDRFDLQCMADGIPTPSITWQLNGRPLAAPPSIGGRSRVVVRAAMREDAGEYTCLATNPANGQSVQTTARVLIKVPPQVVVPPGNQAVMIAEKVLLSCSVVGGDPAPEILWTKNGRPVQLSDRIRQLDNGSLVIFHSTASDAGEYKCIAINDAGTSEGVAMLTVRSAPTFTVEPQSLRVEQGETVMLDCAAAGEPRPDMYWWQQTTELQSGGRFTVMPNNSLRIVATQLGDSAIYRCFASNNIGKTFVEATLEVVVHGGFSVWGPWGDCSATCGQGLHFRSRQCDNPSPANGGRQCVGAATESASCLAQSCPVDGSWGNWRAWDECSVSCGPGRRVRTRECNNPPAQYGGQPCEGEAIQQTACNVQPCAVDGAWGAWEPWGLCSATCGEGVQTRERKCNNPPAQYGGAPCPGNAMDRQLCSTQRCAVDGSWGGWSLWSQCSLSCGGGSRVRQRACDSPRPQWDGAPCPGSDQQVDYCNNEPCPVHGNWAAWSGWGECTVTCSGGQRKRFRTCTNPAPSSGGRPCLGRSEETAVCSVQPCPVDGSWLTWGQWTSCSRSCDGGSRSRARLCQQPLHGGRPCLGDSEQVQECGTQPCYRVPRRAEGNLIGSINGENIETSTLVAEMVPTDTGTRVQATIRNVPEDIAPHLQHLVSLLTPVYWTTAQEVQGAYNGYTLTNGEFLREVQVEFATGEILKMTHYGYGVDESGVLQLDVVVRGAVPDLGPMREVIVAPYQEEYIQTGPGTLYAQSSRLFRVDGRMMPYAWNHTINYAPEMGRQPFLVQQLLTQPKKVELLPDMTTVAYELEASIRPGSPSNRCPGGFTQDAEGVYCKDDDECSRLKPCSHYCHNSPGSFSCSCPYGFTLQSSGRSCQDLDECSTGQANCSPSQECINTMGSFRCAVICSTGYKRAPDSDKCEDINECAEQPGVCEQACQNLVGGYRCSCGRGYRLTYNGRCEDVNECERATSPCTHDCVNMRGTFRCTCPSGYVLINGVACRDINECVEEQHSCKGQEECVNTQGGYQCIELCPPGFRRVASGQCEDIDECTSRRHRCYYNQRCVNSQGSYTCVCPQGFQSRGPGQPCTDVDECTTGVHLCQHNCSNTQGGYMCHCPPGYHLARDGKRCLDVDECLERGVDCGEEKMCFNTRGSYTCIDTPCPSEYVRDPTTNFCVLECVNPRIPCPPGAKYADVIQFRTVALPSGLRAQDLVRLTAYNQDDVLLKQTLFTILENDPKLEFHLRLEEGKGVVYTLQDLQDNTIYRIKVRARSYDNSRTHIQYQTTFIIHISVSAYPY